jgi:hypothetical protein
MLRNGVAQWIGTGWRNQSEWGGGIARNTQYTDQGTSQAEIHLLDYEKMGKILTPQKIKVYLNGQLYEDITIDNVETNIEIPEGTFDLPEEIKALLK